jgi:hypothetical protein
MQVCFVSVHGPRETYFVDEPRSTKQPLSLISLFTLKVHILYSVINSTVAQAFELTFLKEKL